MKKYLALTISEIKHDKTTHDWLEIFANDDILPQIKIYLSPVEDTRLASTFRDIRLVPKVQRTTDHIKTIKRAMGNSSTPCPTELIFKYRPFAKGKFKDQLDAYIYTYITERLQTKRIALLDKLQENPEDNEAAKTVYTAEITDMITKNPLLVFAKDEWNRTPLHVAALDGDANIATYLITTGADLTAKDDYGWTPLHLAAHFGRTAVAECLITNGAEVTATVTNGLFKDSTPLHFASIIRDKKIAEYLIKAGAEVNAKDKDGKAPLHLTASNESTEIAQALITAGAEVNAPVTDGTWKGRPSLHLAAYNGCTEVACLLIAEGGEVNATVTDGFFKDCTPLHLAYNDTIKTLLRNAGAKKDSCCMIL